MSGIHPGRINDYSCRKYTITFMNFMFHAPATMIFKSFCQYQADTYLLSKVKFLFKKTFFPEKDRPNVILAQEFGCDAYFL